MVCTAILLILLELTHVNHLRFDPYWPKNAKDVTSFSVLYYFSCHSDICYLYYSFSVWMNQARGTNKCLMVAAAANHNAGSR